MEIFVSIYLQFELCTRLFKKKKEKLPQCLSNSLIEIKCLQSRLIISIKQYLYIK